MLHPLTVDKTIHELQKLTNTQNHNLGSVKIKPKLNDASLLILSKSSDKRTNCTGYKIKM